jgi:hypothetical protein
VVQGRLPASGAGRSAEAADLQKLVDIGHGDMPLSQLRFRCSNCGSRNTDWVVIARSAVVVQPWREAPP